MIKRIDDNNFLKGLKEKILEDGIAERKEELRKELKLYKTSFMELLLRKARLLNFRGYLQAISSVALERSRLDPLVDEVMNSRPRTVVLVGPPGAGKTFAAYYLTLTLLTKAYKLDDRNFWAFCATEGEIFGHFRNEDVLTLITKAYRKIPMLVIDGIDLYSLTRERESFYRYLISERAGIRADNFYFAGLTVVTVNGLMEPSFLDGINYEVYDFKHFKCRDTYKPALDDFELNSELYSIY